MGDINLISLKQLDTMVRLLIGLVSTLLCVWGRGGVEGRNHYLEQVEEQRQNPGTAARAHNLSSRLVARGGSWV